MSGIRHFDHVRAEFRADADTVRDQGRIGLVHDLPAPGVDHGQQRQTELMGVFHAGSKVRKHAILQIIADIDVHGNHVRAQTQGLGHGTDQGLVVGRDTVPGSGREMDDQALVQADFRSMEHDHALVQDQALDGQILDRPQQLAQIVQARQYALGQAVIQGQDNGAFGRGVEQTSSLAQISNHDVLLLG